METTQPASPVESVDPRILGTLKNLTVFLSLFGMGVVEFNCKFTGSKGDPVTLSGRINASAWSRDLRWAFAALALLCGTAAFCSWCFFVSKH